MNQPEGVIAKDKKQDVQTSEVIVWTKNKHLNNDTKSFNKLVAQFGFIIHEHDKCIYFKNFDNDYIILCLCG